MRLLRRLVGWLVFLALLGAAYSYVRDYVRRHPQDVPWTRLELAHPIGAFTGRKLAALGESAAQCRALLSRAGVEHVLVPPRRDGPNCGYSDGMRLAADDIRYAPAGVVTSCPVAAGLHLLETRIVQPAAMRHLRSRVAAIEHAGSYSCRRLYGRSEGAFSEHATADGFDVTGFRLADGRRVTVLRDWQGESAEAAFLREVSDGACELFSTVLSPEYNAAHSDHLHLDQAERGSAGWRMCR